MLTLDVATALLAVGAAMTISFMAMFLLSAGQVIHARGPSAAARAAQDQLAFVFDGPMLVDSTARAQAYLQTSPVRSPDRQSLFRHLAAQFPTLPDALDITEDYSDRSVMSRDQTQIAVLAKRGTRLRLALRPVEDETDAVTMDRPSLMAMEHELATLRSTTDHTPILVWRQTTEGEITWINRAYRDACAIHGTPARAGLWPPDRLFEITPAEPLRMSLGHESDDTLEWYQFHVTPLGDDFLVSAVNVDTVVKAERSLKTFVQTLSKTFADLPIGLAVFTRDRHLALFNPALTDLTTIAPDKLIARPSIFAFFDMLRDMQMMPEPKNYKTWRDQISALEKSASDGTYQETWHLPFGRTFRVTGHPQIDGAVALLFEDISAETGRRRQFRNELDLGQSVLDSMDDALAVFAPGGVLTLTNRAYDRLWSVETREGMDSLCIADATDHWAGATAPSALWQHGRDFVLSGGNREAFTASARLLDGRALLCHFKPLPGGSTIVSFGIDTAFAPPRPASRTDADPERRIHLA